ncbi:MULTISPECIES: threonine/serine ThrE exporter family protein [unclassified Romboutsia]|uniref:threonine/serine ThrE exporter family protein n=1 Tax=unclassified Romboutsia TaxID=2626894 RepID=UPI000F056278|nr:MULTISPECIES: threonine/serine exporter family protein [unclassified Romboutsia]
MGINRILNFASTAGKMMLQCGGETYRVEETITRICQSFDVDDIDVFASPTAVMVSIIVDGKIHSVVKRISSRSIDLNMVHNINSLSRTIYKNRPDIYFCEKELERLCVEDFYSLKTTLFAAGIATSTFTILFGGGFTDFICAFIIGILTKALSLFLNKSSLNEFFINSICGALVSIYSIILLNLGIITQLDKLVAGSIMLLVPGLSLTNSIRDILEGQLLSGLAKAAEALFIGISTAVGTGTILHLYLKLGGI